MFEILFNKSKKEQEIIQENKKEEYLEKITDTFYRYYDANYEFLYALKKISNATQNEAMWSLDLFLNGDKINLFRFYERENLFHSDETTFCNFEDVITFANNIISRIEFNVFVQIHSGLYLYYLENDDVFFILKRENNNTNNKYDGEFWLLSLSCYGARMPIAHFTTKNKVFHQYSDAYADIMQLSDINLILAASEKMINNLNTEDEETFDKLNDFCYTYWADEALYVLHYENAGVSGKGKAWVLDMLINGATINITIFVTKNDAENLIKKSHEQKCWTDINSILPCAAEIVFEI